MSQQTKVTRNTFSQLPRHHKFLLREPDPIVANLQEVIKADGRRLALIAVEASVTWQTVRNIMEARTTRPHNATCEAIFNACGWRRMIISTRKKSHAV